MPEVRFKPALVGTVADGTVTEQKLADGAVTNVKVNAAAAIVKTKLAALNIVDADIAAAAAIAKTKLGPLVIVDGDLSPSGLSVDSVSGAVKGRASDTTGNKGVLAMGWDTATEEVIIDRES